MSEKRFEEVYRQGVMIESKILRDNETGILYLCHGASAGVGVTALLDQDGKPMIDHNISL